MEHSLYNKQEETYHICTYIANYSIAAGHYLQQTYPLRLLTYCMSVVLYRSSSNAIVLCMREGIVGEREEWANKRFRKIPFLSERVD